MAVVAAVGALGIMAVVVVVGLIAEAMAVEAHGSIAGKRWFWLR
jgi:hypothetical protein